MKPTGRSGILPEWPFVDQTCLTVRKGRRTPLDKPHPFARNIRHNHNERKMKWSDAWVTLRLSILNNQISCPFLRRWICRNLKFDGTVHVNCERDPQAPEKRDRRWYGNPEDHPNDSSLVAYKTPSRERHSSPEPSPSVHLRVLAIYNYPSPLAS